jgi:diaminopropionate ammonia-lyase
MDYLLAPADSSRPVSAAVPIANQISRVSRFYDDHPDLRPTPLHRLTALARTLGVGDLVLKDESERFGLPAFKIAGVTYAVDRMIEDGRIGPGVVLACTTAGNHGRAVARVARQRGLRARVYVPADTVRDRVDAIASEGADVVVHSGGYDDAVATMAADAAREGWIVVSDTSWPGGDDDVPRLIMAGYTRLMDEAAREWDRPPDVVFVQAGVGGLLAAVAGWVANRFGGPERSALRIVSCEPAGAACVLAAARAGAPIVLPGPIETNLAGLRCAEVSHAAWPIIAAHVDAFISVPDGCAFAAMRTLAHPRERDPAVVAGPSGACGLACLAAVLSEPRLGAVREHLGLTDRSRVLVFNTEGNTDPELYARVVGSA